MGEDVAVFTGLLNYYGEVLAEKDGDKYYLTLGDYDGVERVEISRQTYESLAKDFGEKPVGKYGVDY